MKIIKVSQETLTPKDLETVLDALRQGEVVMHPTETCYGLAVDIFNESALQKLYALKQMALEKPVSMMVTSLENAQKYADFHANALKIAKKFWPGPVTLILSRKKALPVFFNYQHTTVGIRCPNSAISQQLLRGFGRPLSTTSANISRLPEVYNIGDYLHQIRDLHLEPAVILDGGSLQKNLPSTIVSFSPNLTLIRDGGLWEDIRKIF